MMNFSGGLFGAAAVFGLLLHVPGAEAVTETVVYSFRGGPSDGTSPESALLDVNGTLYGTTSHGGHRQSGTVFAIDPTTGAEQVLHVFRQDGTDGRNPVGAL